MKNRIREIAIICIVGCIVASMLSSCQRHEKRIFFDVAVSGGILSELDSWKTDEELFKILPLKSEIFVEEDAPSETEIDFVCQEMHSGNKFYYEESLKYCGYSVRSYKYRTESGHGTCIVSTSDNKLLSFSEAPNTKVVSNRIVNMTADDLFSEEQCLEIAEKTLSCLHQNSDQFVLYKTKKSKKEIEGSDFDYIRYAFCFKREIEDVIVCDVEIEVSNLGDVQFVGNWDCFTVDIYDSSVKPDLRKALKDAEEAVNDKMKSIGTDYLAKYKEARLIIGQKNQLILLATYELKNEKSEFDNGTIRVYVLL